MAATRQSSRGRGTSTPRKKIWARTDFAEAIVQTAAGEPFRFNVLGEFEAFYGAQLIGCTVVRVRGRVLLRATGDEGQASAYVAMRVGQDSEFNDPADVNEGPSDQLGRHSDWMFYQPLMLPGAGASGAPAADFVQSNWADIDVRSMRKFDELNESLVLYTQINAVGGYNYTAFVSLSVLVALP